MPRVAEGLYKFARAAVTEHHTRGPLNNRNVLSHSLEAEVQHQGVAGLAPLRRCENLPQAPLLASGGCWHSVVPWLVGVAPRSVSTVTWRAPCVCVRYPLFVRAPVTLVKAHPNDLILT